MRFIKTTFATPWICLWMSNFKFVLRIQNMLGLGSPLSFFDPHFLTMEFEIDRRRYFEFVPEIKLMFGNFRIVTRMSKCILINSVINDPYLANVFVACESKLKSHKNVSWHPSVSGEKNIQRMGHGDSEPNLHLDKCEAFLVTSWIWTRKRCSPAPCAGVCVTSRQ